MPIDVRCPGCGAKYRVSESAAGRSLRCKSPDCGEEISVSGDRRRRGRLRQQSRGGGGRLGAAVAASCPAPALRRKRRRVAKRGRRPLAGRSQSASWPASAGCWESARFSFRVSQGCRRSCWESLPSSGFTAATADFRAPGWPSPASVSAASPRRWCSHSSIRRFRPSEKPSGVCNRATI